MSHFFPPPVLIPVTMRFLHPSSRGRTLASGFCSQLLPRCFTTGRFAGSLLCTSHGIETSLLTYRHQNTKITICNYQTYKFSCHYHRPPQSGNYDQYKKIMSVTLHNLKVCRLRLPPKYDFLKQTVVLENC